MRMRNLLIAFLLFAFIGGVKAQQTYFPPLTGDDWETGTTREMGWCNTRIADLYQFLEENNSKSFMLLKDGKIVLEKYFGTYTPDSVWFWFSAGKSLTAALVGIAQQEGLLSIENTTSTYLGEGWTSMEAEKELAVKVKHQLTMTTGLDESDMYCANPECLVWKADPGTRWFYHNAPYSLLRKVIENATGKGINIFTYQAIGSKIGMGGVWLPVGYNNFYVSKARDMARFGLLVQNQGVWQNDSVLKDAGYYNEMLNSSQELNPSYGYLWWLNGKKSFIPPGVSLSFPGPIAPDAPQDLLLAAGAQGQFISISPSNGLVMVRQGSLPSNDMVPIDFHNEIWKKINQLTCPTNVNERESGSFVLFPNPADGFVNIENDEFRMFRVVIYSELGKLVFEGENVRRIDVSHFQKGVFLVKIQTDSKVMNRKLLVN